MQNRFAFVTGARSRSEVEAYMPQNYAVLGEGSRDERTFYVIGGFDSAGWTLDAYVIPRLASGLIGCEEVSEQQARAVVASSSRPGGFIGLPVPRGTLAPLRWEIRETGSDEVHAVVRATDPFAALNAYSEREEFADYTFPSQAAQKRADGGESDEVTPYAWEGVDYRGNGVTITATLGAVFCSNEIHAFPVFAMVGDGDHKIDAPFFAVQVGMAGYGVVERDGTWWSDGYDSEEEAIVAAWLAWSAAAGDPSDAKRASAVREAAVEMERRAALADVNANAIEKTAYNENETREETTYTPPAPGEKHGRYHFPRSVQFEETPAEELGRLRRELSETDHETPEHGMILDRIAVLVREAAVERGKERMTARNIEHATSLPDHGPALEGDEADVHHEEAHGVTVSPEDAEKIAEALDLFAGIDDGENTDYDELRRLAGLLRGDGSDVRVMQVQRFDALLPEGWYAAVEHTGGGCYWLAIRSSVTDDFMYGLTDGEGSLPIGKDEQPVAGGWGAIVRYLRDPVDEGHDDQGTEVFFNADALTAAHYGLSDEAAAALVERDIAKHRAEVLGVEIDWSPRQYAQEAPDLEFVRLMLDEIEAMPTEQQASAVRAVNDGATPQDWVAYGADVRAATIVILYPVHTPELAHVAETETKVNLHRDALEHLVEEMQQNWPGSTVELHNEDLSARGEQS